MKKILIIFAALIFAVISVFEVKKQATKNK